MLEIEQKGPPTASEPFNLSPSSIRLFQSCPRKFFHRYCNNVEALAEHDDSLRFGTAIHRAIEINVNKPATAWSVAEAVAGLDADLGALVAGTAAAYAVHWAGALVYRAAELELVTELRNPRIVLLTVLDGLAETEAGELVVVDHKSSSGDVRPGSWFYEKLSLDLQVSAYTWAARQNGYAVTEALWDVIAKPKLRRRDVAIPAEHYVKSGKWGKAGDVKPGTGLDEEKPAEFAKRVRDTLLAAPADYFQRAPVVRMDHELEEAVCELEQVGEQVLAAWDKSAWPRNTGSCMAFGRKCEFFEVCTGATSIADSTLFRIRKPKEPTPA